MIWGYDMTTSSADARPVVRADSRSKNVLGLILCPG